MILDADLLSRVTACTPRIRSDRRATRAAPVRRRAHDPWLEDDA